MTSGTFSSLPLSDITKGPRQRKELKDVASLADSIKRLGLIHPIVCTRDGTLVAGERRLEACRSLGWSSISIQFADTLDEIELQKLELEENIKRVDIPWQDQVAATEKLHDLMEIENPNITAKDVAERIGIRANTVTTHLAVAKEMKSNDRIAKAQQFSIARGLTERAQARRRSAEVSAVLGPKNAGPDQPSIICADFCEWARTYSGPKFNFLHADFPYGVGLQKSGQLNAEARGVYDDSFGVFADLLTGLAVNWDRLMEESSHIMFWFSMKYYTETSNWFQHSAIKFSPFPLIWVKSDGAGILPDPQRGPRQVYETAFFGHTGDRKIISAVPNAFSAPSGRATRIHISEKPVPVLSHFFRMIVDENTRMLDPTCGSGTSLRAAETLGAKHVFGIEKDEASAAEALHALNQSRAMRKVSEKTSV